VTKDTEEVQKYGEKDPTRREARKEASYKSKLSSAKS